MSSFSPACARNFGCECSQRHRARGDDDTGSVQRTDRRKCHSTMAAPGLRVNVRNGQYQCPAAEDFKPAALVRAPSSCTLASASRPVWIQISRKSLDVGPDATCTEGLPSNDLTPRGLRIYTFPTRRSGSVGAVSTMGSIASSSQPRHPTQDLCRWQAIACIFPRIARRSSHACLECEHEVGSFSRLDLRAGIFNGRLSHSLTETNMATNPKL